MSRLVDLFVAPAAPARPPAMPRVEAAPAVAAAPTVLAVLCPPSCARLAGAALALAALGRCGAGAGVVCRWSGKDEPAPVPGTATRTARRLAARLGRRGLVAAAAGRLAHVALPAEPADALAGAGRAAAACGPVPIVVVLAGARPAALDPLLGAQDRVVVATVPGAADGVEALAVTGAARVARATGVLRLGAPGPARALTVAGWALAPALRAAAEAALDGHGL
ncbi:hypothetical protein FSW04_09855 [Baekduia soli]|uniref:Uncharacterized protein n=1 Tax=Baekduia soli TaxID=496014 RepID=A0A5B8U474_9ACTN|nr:hypothetical protein [Baekduia soli]QEC47843.1 hypothetical protein FSW04_09855 [Baekduia soli]